MFDEACGRLLCLDIQGLFVTNNLRMQRRTFHCQIFKGLSVAGVTFPLDS